MYGIESFTLVTQPLGGLTDLDQCDETGRFGGVKRIENDSSSIRLRTSSIQLKQSASSTDSDQDMLGLPDATLWNPTSNSVDVNAWVVNHVRNAAALSKKAGVVICRDGVGQFH